MLLSCIDCLFLVNDALRPCGYTVRRAQCFAFRGTTRASTFPPVVCCTHSAAPAIDFITANCIRCIVPLRGTRISEARSSYSVYYRKVSVSATPFLAKARFALCRYGRPGEQPAPSLLFSWVFLGVTHVRCF